MKKISTSKTGFFSIILSLLGLSASSCIIPAMYGCPHAAYDFKGKVTDESNNPIKGIRVIRGFNGEDCFYAVDSTHTLADGTYEILSQNDPVIDNYHFVFKDVDGDLNGGEFESGEINVTVSKDDYKGRHGWYAGKADITVPVVKLTKKN